MEVLPSGNLYIPVMSALSLFPIPLVLIFFPILKRKNSEQAEGLCVISNQAEFAIITGTTGHFGKPKTTWHQTHHERFPLILEKKRKRKELTRDVPWRVASLVLPESSAACLRSLPRKQSLCRTVNWPARSLSLLLNMDLESKTSWVLLHCHIVKRNSNWAKLFRRCTLLYLCRKHHHWFAEVLHLLLATHHTQLADPPLPSTLLTMCESSWKNYRINLAVRPE